VWIAREPAKSVPEQAEPQPGSLPIWVRWRWPLRSAWTAFRHGPSGRVEDAGAENGGAEECPDPAGVAPGVLRWERSSDPGGARFAMPGLRARPQPRVGSVQSAGCLGQVRRLGPKRPGRTAIVPRRPTA